MTSGIARQRWPRRPPGPAAPRLSALVWVLAGCGPAAGQGIEAPSIEPLPASALVNGAGAAGSPESERRSDPEPELKLTDNGVGVIELRPGKGAQAEAGDILEVHYVGRLDDGTEVDSSRARGTPFRFELGAGIVIRGWDEGLLGMRVGELRRLIVPPSMGYGASGAGSSIPPNAMLEFDIELLSRTPPSP